MIISFTSAAYEPRVAPLLQMRKDVSVACVMEGFGVWLVPNRLESGYYRGLHFGADYGVGTPYGCTGTPCSAKEARTAWEDFAFTTACTELHGQVQPLRVSRLSTIVLDTCVEYHSLGTHTLRIHTDLFAFQRRRCLACKREWRDAALVGLATSGLLTRSQKTKGQTSPWHQCFSEIQLI
jgi:hypothetical protein